MKNNVWAKTILYVYKKLDNMAESYDRIIEKQALHSFYYFSGNKNNSVMEVSKRIIDLSERKVKLINIKVLTEQALNNCDEKFAQILVERYIDNDKGEEIATRHNLSIRTYFRRLIQAEEKFMNYFAMKGFNENKLNEYLKDEKWIKDIYLAYLTKKLGEDYNEIELEEAL